MNKEESKQRYTKIFFYQIFLKCNRGCVRVGITATPARRCKGGPPWSLQLLPLHTCCRTKNFFEPKSFFLPEPTLEFH